MDNQPDISIGVHTTYGFTARLRNGADSDLLSNTGFVPLPGQNVYTLTGTRAERFDTARLARAVELLNQARATVAIPPGILPRVAPSPRPDPDVMFGRHPELGIIATVTDGFPRAEAILLDHGFKYRAHADIFAFPAGTPNSTAMATAAVALRHLRAEGHIVAATSDITLRRSQPLVPRFGTMALTPAPSADQAEKSAHPSTMSR
ncbi:hypothetical protein H1V43_22290 [Streptomyces sp. PSKA54]|uniref:Uncharacterized protein n=1 Tax=Streptomyces himalayensis subsp. aureolus TaxID=2758039 RepID=A0A7W2D3Q6_9ACTN|nr:hypothetical protein [Streptomyces himalayensis]MBA4864037.1 hypothetical protein [Streptomyces himalayensis subsp. aureolus]